MKWGSFFLMAAIFLCTALLFSGCGKSSGTLQVQGYTIDRTDSTISRDGVTYHYQVIGDSVTITYPDQSTYQTMYQNGGSFSGWSEDYDPDNGVPGDVLTDLVCENAVPKRDTLHWILSFLCWLLGGFILIFPKASWYVCYGWRFQNTEPSSAALIWERITGVILIIAGFICIFI